MIDPWSLSGLCYNTSKIWIKPFHSSKLEEFSDNNFELDENGTNIFKGVEKTVGKGESLIRSNFSFFPSVFKQLVLQTCKNQDLFGKGLTLDQTTKFQTCPN